MPEQLVPAHFLSEISPMLLQEEIPQLRNDTLILTPQFRLVMQVSESPAVIKQIRNLEWNRIRVIPFVSRYIV